MPERPGLFPPAPPVRPRSRTFCILTRFPGKLRRRAVAQRDQEQPMLNLRYVVVSEESRWQIVRGGRRFPETYPSKNLAICSAIAFAERDGLAGRRAEVMVRHENGLFITEWVFGEDVHAAKVPDPLLLADNAST